MISTSLHTLTNSDTNTLTILHLYVMDLHALLHVQLHLYHVCVTSYMQSTTYMSSSSSACMLENCLISQTLVCVVQVFLIAQALYQQ